MFKKCDNVFVIEDGKEIPAVVAAVGYERPRKIVLIATTLLGQARKAKSFLKSSSHSRKEASCEIGFVPFICLARYL